MSEGQSSLISSFSTDASPPLKPEHRLPNELEYLFHIFINILLIYQYTALISIYCTYINILLSVKGWQHHSRYINAIVFHTDIY